MTITNWFLFLIAVAVGAQMAVASPDGRKFIGFGVMIAAVVIAVLSLSHGIIVAD